MNITHCDVCLKPIADGAIQSWRDVIISSRNGVDISLTCHSSIKLPAICDDCLTVLRDAVNNIKNQAEIDKELFPTPESSVR